MKKTKVLVTGGAGFIGSHLVDRLIEEGHEVLVIDSLYTGRVDQVNPQAEFIHQDINLIRPHKLKQLLKKVDTVYHLAARARVQPSFEMIQEYHESNVTATLRLLEASYRAEVRRFVFSSSSSVYGQPYIQGTNVPSEEFDQLRPMSPYAVQKVIAEQYCEFYYDVYRLETVCLRYFNVYGERMIDSGVFRQALPYFLRLRQEGKPLTITGDGNQRRDFTFVGDVVDANLRAAVNLPARGGIYNIGSGHPVTLNEIADWIGGPREYIEQRQEPRYTLADNRRAEKDLGWKPTVRLEDWIKEKIHSYETESAGLGTN
jgi:UDP-glucose 4-epimerase